MTNTNVIEANEADQMELGLAGRRARGKIAALNHRQRRAQRANWWFKQMRRVVDHARDWQSSPPARHEQVYLTLATRRNW
jgi:hypothetical protein